MSRVVAWQPQPGPQALAITCPATEILFGGAIGGGKALSNNELALSPFGWKRMGGLKVGDRLCATDGSVTEVIGVYPQGVKQMWRVTLSDGTSVLADDDHNWYGWRVGKTNKIGGNRVQAKSGAQVWKTREIREWVERTGHRFAIPVTDPVATNVAGQLKGRSNFVGREIDPYILGVLLGDGCMTTENITVTSEDDEIIESLCRDGDASVYDTESNAKSIKFTGDRRKELAASLDKIGLLGCRSETKFIPRQYQMAPVQDRWQILRGLMDTDGWAEEGRALHYSSASKMLADDVRDLALSLGASATTRVKKMNHVKDTYFDANCVRMKFRNPTMAFNLSRKKAVAATIKHQSISRYIESVTPAEAEPCTCIQVRHPNGLFITTGFVVTHNSDWLLGDWVVHAEEYGAACRGIIFRRNLPDMDDLIARSHEIYGAVYGSSCYNVSKSMWTLPNKASLRFRAIENDNDVYKFHGQQPTWVGFDELTQWATDFAYTYMFTRCRSAKGMPVRFRATTNPGNVGHSWVKARFIDPAPPYTVMKIVPNPERPDDYYERVFIPSRLEDNKILMKNDPGYANRVFELSDKKFAEALRTGNWDITAGAAFTEWKPDIHIVPTEDIPLDARLWNAMDWGYVTPYGNLWLMMGRDGDVVLPGELYGWGGKPNVGTKEDPEIVREKLKAWEASRYVHVGERYLDPQCWEKRGSEASTADRLSDSTMSWRPWPKGPNSRVNQKQVIHQLLSVTNGRSRLKVMDCCRHFIRTFPTLQTDKNNPEDVDTKGEDHMYDAFRGGVAKKIPSREDLARISMANRMRREQIVGYDTQYGGW